MHRLPAALLALATLFGSPILPSAARAQELSFASSLADLQRATDSALAAGDSILAARTLTWRSIKSGNADLAVRALGQIGPRGDVAALTLALLAGEYGARRRGLADADTVMVTVCRLACGQITDDAPALSALLLDEIRSSPRMLRGRGAAFIVSLLGRKLMPGREAELQAMGWMVSPLVEKLAIDDAVSSGRRSAELTLRYAAAYAALPLQSPPVAGGRETREQASAALALAPKTDTLARARLHGLLALGHMRGGQLDSAKIQIALAISLSASLPPALRATMHRRAAVIAAVSGDTLSTKRSLDSAIVLRRGDTVSVAFDKLRVSRELSASTGHGALALRLSRDAWNVLRGGIPVTQIEVAVAQGEAHRANASSDSAAWYFAEAAKFAARSGSHAEAMELLAAAAESRLEFGAVEEALALMNRAAAYIQAWPWDRRGPAHRMVNNLALLAVVNEEPAMGQQLLANLPTELPGSPEYAETESLRELLRLIRVPAESLLTGTWWRRNEVGLRYVTETQNPARARLRPLTDARWAIHGAELALVQGDLGAAYTAAREGILLADSAGHGPTQARANAVMATLFSVAGREDSASTYRARSSGSTLARATARVVLTPDSLRSLRRLAPDVERKELETRLAEARRVRSPLSELWVAAALAEHHFRRATPRRPDRATAYYDTAATAVRLVKQTGLPDWYRIQLAERVYDAQADAVLAWLARAPEVGERNAALAALAAADRQRGAAFNLMTGAGYSGSSLSSRVFLGTLTGANLIEAGGNLLAPAFVYGSGPRMLVFHQTRDTLVRWLRIPHGDQSGQLGTRVLEVSRVAISADSLARLVTRARNALGVDAAATRSILSLEPASREALRGVVAGRPASAGAAVELRALANVLLPNGLLADAASAEELLLVASGSLASVPFTALPIDTAETPLSSRVALRYVPSLLWSVSNASSAPRLPRATRVSIIDGKVTEDDAVRKERVAWLRRAIVLGNPAMPSVQFNDAAPLRLDPLPGAEREARAVATALGVTPLLGAGASVAAVAARSTDATIVHLATHGYAFGTESLVGSSFVALAPSATDDGLLTVQELLDARTLRLSNANLVVLSACQTGLGQLTASEGTLGLQRAFLAAGAASVLVSLWSVSDEATAALLESFYKNWLGDLSTMTKAQALRAAQEELRRDPRYRHPRHWAAFQLVGSEAGSGLSP